MLTALFTALYERVILAYKSTLIGLLFVAADVVVAQLQIAALPSWAHAVVGLVASILALYKPKAPAVQPVP